MHYLDRRTAIANANEPTLIEKFNRDHSICEMLEKFGYEKASEDEWISPNSSSGHKVKVWSGGTHLTSLSTSDIGIGVEGKNGGINADAFSLLQYYQFGGDMKNAIEHLKTIYPRSKHEPSAILKEQSPQGNAISWKKASELKDKCPPERQWVVHEWIPSNQVTLLYGDGGTGKSLLAQQLCASVALDKPWIGLPVKEGNALYLTAEDDEDELHRRFDAIANGMMIDVGRLSQLEYTSLVGSDALLAVQEPVHKQLMPTNLLMAVEQKIAETKPNLTVIDTLADVFPGDENQRVLARQFISLLRGPAVQHNCAILVLAHPSLTGINSGTGTSGSTGWNNSVRSRMYLRRDLEDENKRILQLAKSNYSKIGTEVKMLWTCGYFEHDGTTTTLDNKAASAMAKRVFLELLRKYTEQGRTVNANGGSNYAPKAFAEDPLSEGITKNGFRTAMRSLFHEGKITNEQSKRATCIIEKVNE
ncbi:AAA family ATPase [Paracoccaceae bacterium]|nr:AAA family ATPase [Paracoccaceae bacterium]